MSLKDKFGGAKEKWEEQKSASNENFSYNEKTGIAKLKIGDEKVTVPVKDYDTQLTSLTRNIRALEISTQKRGNGSIASVAKQNIFEFPVFVADDVPLDCATATATLLEQMYASYLQMAISINPVIDAAKIVTGQQFDHLKTDVSKYIECAETFYQSDSCYNEMMADDGSILEFSMLNLDDADATIINESMDYVPLSEFDHYFQEATAATSGKGGAKIDAADRRRKIEKENVEIGAKKQQMKKTTAEMNDLENRAKINKDAADHIDADRRRKETADEEQISLTKAQRTAAERQNADHDEDRKMAQEKHQMAMEKNKFDTKVKAAQFVDDSKLQKLNTMKPLLMVVNVRAMDSNKTISDALEYVVGVKTHMRVIDSSVLPEVAKYPLKEMDSLSRKVKWRAGELKFFKDLVLKIKQRKQSAVDAKDPKRKWYRRLYTIAHDGIKNKWGKTVVDTETARPNCSLVITKSDVDSVKMETGIDLLNGGVASTLCSEMFLMSIVVVDPDAQSIKILIPDLHSDYEVHSIAAINKQIALLDTSSVKANNMFKLLG